MSITFRSYVVNNICLPPHASVEEAFSVAKKKLEFAGISGADQAFSVYRRSIDARKKNDIKFVYSIAVKGAFPYCDKSKLAKYGISVDEYTEPVFIKCLKKLDKPIVVVGSGPAGLFSALSLAENGYPVVLIEKGGTVEERRNAIESFRKTRILDESTNIQFGAGGAGTFSDGKLVTRINDSMSCYVLKRLVEFGAPEEILYLAKPHIGTDILSRVVENVINRITSLGGTVMFHTELIDYKECLGRITEVITNKGNISCSALLLAVGHSARNTYERLFSHGVNVEAKSFSVGMRIEHLVETIDRGLYGDMAGSPLLPKGEYNLSYNTKKRGVYTFCMCPGGEVVAATSEEGGVVTNGMSNHSRNGRNSNSAVCCTVFKEDYGATPREAISFQRRIEKMAFVQGGKDYSAPIITVGDFLRGECKTEPKSVCPTYMNGEGVRLARPESFLPEFVVSSIKGGLIDFDKKIKGFASDEAVLTGAETRTSSPIRILRDNSTRLAIGYENLYPSGEGAGYAGGITSAAIDGIRCAMAIMDNFNN